MSVAVQTQHSSLIDRLPPVRGKYREQAELSSTNWFRVGGPAEVLFRPADAEDLAQFLRLKPKDVHVTVLGVGSNLIVRDGGIEGVVIRLGRGFTDIGHKDGKVIAGAGALCLNVALFCQQQGLAGLEFLSGIPGTIGGVLAMNGGAYGREVADVLEEAELVDGKGNLHKLKAQELGYSYRKSVPPEGAVFTCAVLLAQRGDPENIAKKIQEITTQREATQPVRARTGGSTFKNPPGAKAWELIDKAGCRGLVLGGAQVSEKHCNFLINNGTASAADLENLGEEVRRRVKEKTGVELEWEIKRIGKPA